MKDNLIVFYSFLFCLRICENFVKRVFPYFQMQQEQSQSVSFESDVQKKLFSILTTKTHFQDKIYTEQDLQVDLVLRLQLPSQRYIPRRDDYPFNELFYNTPSSYGQAYQTVRQYINFQVDSNINQGNFKESATKAMTSIYTLQNSQQKTKSIFLDESEGQSMIIDCCHSYFPEMDVFTLKYNMIMLILQSLCGFRVKTFIMEQSKQKYVYFLLSHSIQNLLKLADRHHIMKEVNMVQVDFNLNDPVDRAERPLRFHSYFKSREDLMFQIKQKTYSRILKLKNNSLQNEIVDEAKLSKQQIKKYIAYYEQYQECLRQLSNSQINVSVQQKQYIFLYNRGKSNEGCYKILKQIKLRELLYNKIKKLNKKYGYPVYEYDNCYFKFQLPLKNRSFFDRLALLLNYKAVTVSLDGQISLFNNMERSKLAYHSLQSYLKIQNLYKIGLQAFAINNNYQRFGTTNYNFFSQVINMDILDILKRQKKHRLIDEWHGFNPLWTNICAVRGYMGQKFAYQLLVKIHLISFFAYLIPLSIAAQLIGTAFYMTESNAFIYQFSLIYLVAMIICLTLFQVTWKIKQDEFIRHFVEECNVLTHEQNYKGPYIRNIIDDQPNEYTSHLTIWNRIIRFFAFLGVGILILIEAFYFYGLRNAILMNSNRLPSVPTIYLSIPHLIFYGVFFWSNYLIYRFVFFKIIVKLIEFQNFPTKQQHQKHLRGYVFMFTFGVELLGPLFIYVIEPLQGNSCYSSSCIYEFSIYIYSRYTIIFSFLLIKIIYVVFFYFTGSIIEIKDVLFQSSNKSEYKTFQEKYSDLLIHIQKQYKKKEISFQAREEALSLYYYCIYSISFPFCSVLAFGLLLLDYIIVRIDVLRNGRRPIPNSRNIIRLSGIYNNIIHLCIIVNSWSVIYIQQVLEYNFPEIIEYFVVNVTQDNILLLKIFFSGLLILFLQIISATVQKIASGLGDWKLSNRKVNTYNSFITNNGHGQKLYKATTIEERSPMKTIFRAYNLQSLGSLKKSRFKQKNKANYLKELNQKFYAPYTRRETQQIQPTIRNSDFKELEQQIMEETQSQLAVKHHSLF